MSTPESSPPVQRARRFNPWYLLLLVPLVMLVTPWFNRATPKIAGLPFFYWFQFAFVPVGVACVGIVVAMTRRRGPSSDRHGAGGDA